MDDFESEGDIFLQLLKLLNGADGRLVLLHDVRFAEAIKEMQKFLDRHAGVVSSSVAQDILAFKTMRGLCRRICKFKQQQKKVSALCNEWHCVEEIFAFKEMLKEIAKESPEDALTILSIVNED